MPKFDVIVIGSGLAGLHAAEALTESSARVAMVDVGFNESADLETGAPLSFEDIRQTDPLQHELFFGKDLSGITERGNTSHSAHMTSGRRAYITQSVEGHGHIRSSDVTVLQSLAQGGLSGAWGGVCGFFDEGECRAAHISQSELVSHYKTIIDRIGISGSHDHYPLQPQAQLDDNASHVVKNYQRQKSVLDRLGFVLEQPPLALLTEDKDMRKKTAYRDMDFWDNIGRSVYRGHYTLEVLQKHKNFSYINKHLVTKIEHKDTYVIVHAKNIDTKENVRIEARAVIVAAGALNTTRLLLQSFNLVDVPTPIIVKSNYLIPCLIPSRLGKSSNVRKHSLCQLALYDKEVGLEAMGSYAQLYSYNSLLLYKLLRFVPLPKPEALSALSLVVPSMILVDVRLPSVLRDDRYAIIKKDSNGAESFHITYPHEADDERKAKQQLKRIKKTLRHLGLIPLRTVRNPIGVAAHYAGGAPYSDELNRYPLSVNRLGQLHTAPRIFVADSATWTALPAKPPGLTIMANANRIGAEVKRLLDTAEL